MNLNNLLNFRNLFRGKDKFTKTRFHYFNQILQGKEAQYITIDDKEAEIYNTTVELQAVLGRKAQMFSNGIYKHYRMNGTKVECVENSPYITLLENPNPLQSRNEQLKSYSIQNDLYGNSFMYKLQGLKSAPPKNLWLLPSNYMRIIPTGKVWKQTDLKDIVSKYELHQDNLIKETFTVDEIMHIFNYNAENPIKGVSPLFAVQMALSNIRGAYGYRNVLINERGAVGMISNDSKDTDGGIPMTGTEEKDFVNNYLNNYGTGDSKAKILLTSSSLKWTPFNYPTKDLMLFEEISEDFKKIIDHFGLNQYLFSFDKGTTFANLEEGKKLVYQDTIIPMAELFTYKLSNFLGLDTSKEWIELDYSHIEVMQENESTKSEVLKRKAEALKILVESGMTLDEVRNMLGWVNSY